MIRSRFQTLTVDITVKDGENSDLGELTLVDMDVTSDDGDDALLIALILAVVAVAIVIVVVLIWKKKGGK